MAAPFFKLRAIALALVCIRSCTDKYWQARRDSNPQHPVLETGALPVGATGLHIAKKPSGNCTPKMPISSRDEPYGIGIGDKISSSPDARWSSFCSWWL